MFGKMSWHITPVDDTKEHELLSTCECCPKLIIENGEMIFVHNAYDEREIIEQITELITKPNTTTG